MKNNENNDFEILYDDERIKELKQYFKTINFQFKVARITYILTCIFTLKFNRLLPRKKNTTNVDIDVLIASIDKKN